MPQTLIRLLVGLAVAALIAAAARRSRSLTRGGAVAATAVGTIAVGAGWSWGALLVVFFVSSSALSRYGRTVKEARTSGVVEKGGERDAVQVLANGGVLAFGALGVLLAGAPYFAWWALGAGALASSTSDTWATEIGTLVGGTPRSLVTGQRLAPGISGAVTLAGTLAAIVGAAFIASLAVLLGWPRRVGIASVVGGIAGSFVDSLLGATLQSRRWCDHCDRGTERARHDCGELTRRAGGIGWLGNDAVNAASSAAGALITLLITAFA